MTVDAAVEVKQLTRLFAPKRSGALGGTGRGLTGDPGREIHGLLGPNGVGKTTLVKVLSTILLPNSGTARVFGRDVVTSAITVRPLLGIVFGAERGLYWRLPARRDLEYWGALYRVPTHPVRHRAQGLKRVGLADRAETRLEEYSRGMKQRLHLARWLMGGSKDPLSRRADHGARSGRGARFRKLVAELRDEGRTILITTHDMGEAETICGRVTVIDRDKVLATKAPRTLARLISRFHRVEVEDAPEAVVAEVADLPGVNGVTRMDGNVRIEVAGKEEPRALLRRFVDAGVTSLRTTKPSLEEIYVHLIGDRGLEV